MISRPKNVNKPSQWLKQLPLRAGKEDIIARLEMLTRDAKTDDHHLPYKTKNVHKKVVKRLKKWFEPLTDKSPQKLEILPVGGMRMCHQNADEAVEYLMTICRMMGQPYTWRVAVGYNLMACPCGRDLFGEVHSVIYCEELGEYFDLTEDMYGETHKWFIECPHLTRNYTSVADRKVGGGNRKYDMLRNEPFTCKRCGIADNDAYANYDLTPLTKIFGD